MGRRRADGRLGAVVVAAMLALTVAWSADASGPSFATFELAGTPPAAAGTTCPGSGSACTNIAAEPQIRADLAGTFYATSENGLGGGTDAWKSTDGGRHYASLVSPNGVSSSNTTGFAPGGGDTDLATASSRNAAGFFNVYVASLSLANVDVSTSKDGGGTWSLNPIGATISGDDREWIAADGASKVCISYHDAATFNIDVNCSFDAGATFTQIGAAFDTTHAWLAQNNEIGNLAIDPSSHYVYQTFSGIANAGESVCDTNGTCGYHVVYVAVSKDGGKTFTDHVVHNDSNAAVSYGHQFVNLSVDGAGNLYSVFTDNHNVFVSYSTDHGSTWSPPRQLNSKPSNTAIMPWSTALSPGKVDVVWYGTSYYDGVNPPDSYPASAAWQVYMAQNTNVLGNGRWSQASVTSVIHYGGVCEGGISCTGNRDLYDDFGVAASPTTGLASIVFSDDQYSAAAASASCTPSATNTGSCDHTMIATQIGGSGIK